MLQRRFVSTPRLRLLSLLLCYSLLSPQLMIFLVSDSAAAPTNNALRPARQRPPSKPQGQHRPGELLVRFRQETPDKEINAVVSSVGVRRGGRLRGESGIERLKLSAAQNLEAIIESLRLSPVVEFAEPNFLITADEAAPNDPRFDEQWALHNNGATGGQYGADIAAAQAWKATVGSPSTIIALIDSGVDFNHADLRSNRWINRAERSNYQDDEQNGFVDDLYGWDWVANNGDSRDEQGHGTAVAGIIAAEGNNGIGISGVMWRASLMSLRVLDREGTGDIAQAVEAIDYATAHGAQVINCSWGTESESAALLEALRRAAKRGVLVVCSAGNNGQSLDKAPRYPASYELDNIIAVAATDEADKPASWSNWGAQRVAVAAPGVNVLSTKMGGDYQTINGSSAAAPFVSGVAGLIRTLRPWLTAERTRELIMQGARPVPALSGKVSSNGIVSAPGALEGLRVLLPSEGLQSSEELNGGDNPGSSPHANANGLGGTIEGLTNERRLGPRPKPGAEVTALPNLDAARREQPVVPRAAPPIPSTKRSPRNPLPLPPGLKTDAPRSSPPSGFSENNAPNQAPLNLLAINFDIPNAATLLSSGQKSVSDSPFSLFSARPAPSSVRPAAFAPQSSTNSLSVNGTNYAQVPNSASLNITGAVTVEAWFKTNVNTATQSIVARFGDPPNNDGGYLIYLTNTGKLLFATLRNGGDSDGIIGSTTVSTGVWHHVAGVFDGTQLRVYLDGTLDGSKSSTFAPVTGTQFLRIGAAGTAASGVYTFFNGLVDEVRVSTGALYTADFSPSAQLSATSGTQGLWKFDGQTVNDSSGNGNHGALYNSAAYSTIVPEQMWTNVVGVRPGGHSLTKPGSDAWDAGAVSVKSIAYGEGSVEFTATETNTYRMCGLGNGDSSQSYPDIEFAIYLRNDGLVQIYEQGAPVGTYGSYQTGDRFRVSVANGVVKYWRNGALFATSTTTATYPLLADTALYSTGARLKDVVLTLPANQQPNANAGGPYSATTATPVQFNGSASSDPDGTISNYAWNFGDGSTASGVSPTHAYATAGNYTATLTVTDNLGATHSATAAVAIGNSPPIANAGGSYTGETNVAISLNGSNSSDSDGTITSYSWNFGDGTTGTGVAPSHVYSSPNIYSASLTVTDNNGGQHTASALVTVSTTKIDQFVRDFHQLTLARQPDASEQAYWNDLLRSAHAQGQDSLVLAAQELGRTLFESTMYAERNRSNQEYVYDLYRAYLQRGPEPAGWDYWTSAVASQGRESVRNGFAYSSEFGTVVSRLVPNGTAGSNPQSLLTARVEPFNNVGQAGVDPISRNFSWSLPLVNLPGRAGLDLSLSLAYNSLVWTKSGPYVYFDEDGGSPSPGFRLGFPVVQGRLFNAATSQDAYLLISPSGSRTELRQVGSSNVYESADSSNLQLIANADNTLTVRATDGTQLTYERYNLDYRCTRIKDVNGNFLSISYNVYGQITTMTDTLARVLTVNYDTNQNPSSITQTWNGQTHVWASFGYDTKTIQTSFAGVSVVGIKNGASIPMLTQVSIDDGNRYNFDYSTWGQVSQITHSAADNHQLSYTSYAMDAGAQSDCPRVAQKSTWAENWNLVNGVATAVATAYAIPISTTWAMPNDNTQQSGTMSQITLPDGTSHKLFYHSSGWDRGLPMLAETWFAGTRQRWSTTNWTQDNTALSYPLNPRPIESNVGDQNGNRQRTTVTYTLFGLPSDVSEYAADATTLLRRTHTDYNLEAAYINQRIIGLPSASFLYDGTGNLYSKVDYQYDQGGEFLVNQGTPVQHDGGTYSVRGLTTTVRRWDVTSANDATKAVVSRIGYNTTGSPIFMRDPLGSSQRQVTISYTDSFSDTNNPQNTLAYVTQVTDPGGYSSSAQYNYEFGAVTRTQDPKGAVQKTAYDSAHRVQQITTEFGSNQDYSHTRFVYPLSQNRIQRFTTIEAGAGEAFSIRVFDGAGRIITTAGDHPNSAGLFRGQKMIYDELGRVEMQSLQVEVDSSWTPAGLDAGDWKWVSQQYDWNGRVILTTDTDNKTTETKYEGCGCAGGAVVITRDQVGRRRKTYSDSLGRVWKTQVLHAQPKTEALNGEGDVYSTIINTLDVRDQATNIKHYQGLETSGTYQEAALEYDGHGRLWKRHLPEQDAGTMTTLTYNADDTTNVMTDARGATTTYSYNTRRLVSGITYGAPAGVTGTAAVAFDYDAAGNRLWMTYGQDRVDYQYDTLSRLTQETRAFSELGASYTLTYEYNPAGDLKSVADPSDPGRNVSYARDHTGRVSGVSGGGYGGVAQYATSMQYRAWGRLKHLTYGNNLNLDIDYNNRQQVQQYEVTTASNTRIMGWQYEYHGDGMLRYSRDLRDDRLDRAYVYNDMARLIQSLSGSEARGNPVFPYTGPYKQTYGFDVWGNLTNRSMRVKTPFGPSTSSYGDTYVNNRNTGGTSQPWIYDADGRVTNDRTRQYGYDAAGRMTYNSERAITQVFDGDGRRVNKIENCATI